jgi:excisionase family DNA binding protein
MRNGNHNGGGHRPLLSIRDLSVWLQCSPSTIRRAIKEGTVPALRLGCGRGCWRFQPDAIERWILDKQAALTALQERGEWLFDKPRKPRWWER